MVISAPKKEEPDLTVIEQRSAPQKRKHSDGQPEGPAKRDSSPERKPRRVQLPMMRALPPPPPPKASASGDRIEMKADRGIKMIEMVTSAGNEPETVPPGTSYDGFFMTLTLQLRENQAQSYAKGTYKNYTGVLNRFTKFCKMLRVDVKPTCENLLLYMQYLCNEGLVATSIKRHVSALKTIGRWEGYQIPDKWELEVTMLLRGIEKQQKHQVRQALPFTPEILQKIFKTFDRSSKDTTMWAIFVTAFLSFLRKSHFTVNEQGESEHLILQKHVKLLNDRVELVIVSTKTSLETMTIPLLKNENKLFCPVRAIELMRRRNPEQGADAPAFIVEGEAVKYADLLNEIKHRVRIVGLDPTKYSSHSFRRGGATTAAQAGLTENEIKNLGGWKSECFRQYIQDSYQVRLMSQEKITNYFNKL